MESNLTDKKKKSYGTYKKLKVGDQLSRKLHSYSPLTPVVLLFYLIALCETCKSGLA